MFVRKLSSMAQRHLRQYNPFVEFKSDVHTVVRECKSDVYATIRDFKVNVNNILDKHIQMTNIVVGITIAGFGGLGGGLVMLYQKTEFDKKELNDKIDNNRNEINSKVSELNAKLDLILSQISTPKKTWF